MSAELKSRDEYTGPVSNMEHNLEPRSSGRKQISNATKKKVPSYQAHQSLMFKKMSEVVYPFDRPYIDQNVGLRQQIDDDHVVQLKFSRSFQKQQRRCKTDRQEELVRHMSNLPAYLQQVEKQKNVQDKALNFGVLDWKHLETWKYNERMPARAQRKASLGGNSLSMANLTSSLSKPSLHRKQSSKELHLKSSHDVRFLDCVQQFPGKVKHIQDSQNTSSRTVSRQQIDISQKVKSSGRSYPEIGNVEGMRIKADEKTATIVKKEILFSNQIKQTLLSSLPMTDQFRKRTTRGDETNTHPKYSADEPQPIVLLVPKIPPKRSSAQNSQLAESRTSYDGELTQDNPKRFSDCFSSQELHSVEPYDEIPHSCPLPASVSIAQGTQSDVCACPHQNDPPIMSRQSGAKCREEENSSDNSSVSVGSSEGMDLDTNEQPAVKGRHPSPNRRFSFSFGRLSRSFSFKESSTAPQLSSTCEAAKSGPVSSEVLAGIDDCYIDKAHTGERKRSSPFRRLLDPIMKPKGAHSVRMVQSSYKSMISESSEPINTNKQVQDQTHQASTFQAILQLTIRNGLPYFKFVVDNSSDILAAAVKKSVTSGKADCSLAYTFYSVREIKRKTGGWISHRSKDKSCSFAYNIIAEMKSIYCHSDKLREFVLYTVDIGRGDKGQPEVLPDKEIAAIIVRDTATKVNGGESKEVNECKQEGLVQCSLGDICDRGEKENFNSTIAILPGGVHSSPNGSAPSSLIYRWRSGGLCDCGGWDIGCKLRVLTDKKKKSNCSTSAMSSSAPERVDLFNQNREGRSQPNFSLTPLKDGLYSVKFNASIPSLEAFSISAAVITSTKFPDILDLNFLPEAKLSAESMKQAEKIKNPDRIQVQLPAKYVPSPPPSPVGRI